MMNDNGLVKEFMEVSCTEYVQLLAGADPVPGGGGACALAGALGTALGNMVGSLTVGKKKYRDVEARIIELKASCDILQKEFLALSQMDAEVFEPLSRAYRMPSDTEEEKREKEKVMEEALDEACMVPLRIMEKCCEAIDMIEEFAAKGSRLAVSDAGVAALFCCSALEGASLNVFINTKAMKDRQKAADLNRQAEEMLEKYPDKARTVFDAVLGSLKS